MLYSSYNQGMTMMMSIEEWEIKMYCEYHDMLDEQHDYSPRTEVDFYIWLQEQADAGRMTGVYK